MIRILLLGNLLLALIWVALTGKFTAVNFFFGFLLSYFIMWVMATDRKENGYFTRGPKIVTFICFFLYELVKANLQVAYHVISLHPRMKPGIVSVPLDVKSDLEITLLANLITLTPGTLSLDVSNDKKVLYVHAMYIKDKNEFINGVKDGFERRIIEILR